MSSDQDLRRQTTGAWACGRDLLPRPLDSVSLYVHIPFCQSRCRYCSFYFETGWSPHILERTLDTILAESRFFRDGLFPGRPARVHTVYFGGGTPSVVPPAMLEDFLDRFRTIWNLAGSTPGEFAFEANPESFGPALLAVLARQGVDRISLGIQSFDSEALQSLGRRADGAQVNAALDCLAEARAAGRWRGRFNLDLICGIPGQTLARAEDDVRRALDRQPDHLSLYSLSEEPGTALAQLYAAGRRLRPEDEQVEAQLAAAAAILESAGLRNYEVSNFARPGCESRHNLAYWELRPYLGLGPGAVGTLPVRLASPGPAEDGWLPAIARLTNPVSMAYSRPGRSGWQHQAEILSPRDFLLDHFVVGLRTEAGVDPARIEGIFRLPPDWLSTALGALRRDWQQRGLASAGAGKLALTPEGRALLNPLLLELFECLDGGALPEESLARCPDWPGPAFSAPASSFAP